MNPEMNQQPTRKESYAVMAADHPVPPDPEPLPVPPPDPLPVPPPDPVPVPPPDPVPVPPPPPGPVPPPPPGPVPPPPDPVPTPPGPVPVPPVFGISQADVARAISDPKVDSLVEALSVDY
ncbi:MAG: hypothetical protein ACRDUV_26300 [Pseudonocardiaceae bacterium]